MIHSRSPVLSAVLSTAVAVAASAAADGALAQGASASFPTRPITMIVPFAPGGSAEVLGREFGIEMPKLLGQNVIIELRPGAGGNIGAEYVAKQSRADGYTVLLGSLSVSTNVSLMRLNWDPRKDLVPVAGIATVPNLLVIATDSPWKTVTDLVNTAKAKPGALFFGSSGPGTSSHLAGELFQDRGGVTLTHVPYKGSGAVYPDLIAGRVNMLFDLAGSAVGQISGGKVRALATTARKRSPAMPDVPSISETFAGFDFGSWFALFAMWIYTTAAVTAVHFGTSDTSSTAYNEGANWVGVLFGVYNGVAALAAFAIPVIARRTGRKPAHAINLALGGLGLIGVFLIRDPQLLWLPMIGVGIAWASILSMPYAILAGAVPGRKMGVYMGIFNIFIVVPQLLAATILGLILKNLFDSQAIWALVLGGVSFFIAAACSLRVTEPKVVT